MSPVIGTDTSTPTEPSINPSEPAPISKPAGQVLEGTESHDLLVGSQGNDTINGKNGNDWICGGSGNDHLWGDNGTDIFAFGAAFAFSAQFGRDTIEDFQAGLKAGHDFITFKPDLFGSFDAVMSNTTDTVDGALITSDDGSILLKGVLKSVLVETNFYFI